MKNRKYLSLDIVNEQINLMGQALLRQLLVGIHSVMWYAVMADETRDISIHEQATVRIRWVDKYYEVHEDFIGLVNVPNDMAETITSILKDILIRCNLPLSMCRSQAYDGATNMSGRISGVATKMLQEEPAALHVHCQAHCLNLCLQDAARQFQPIRDVLDLCIEIGKLILLSAKRMQLLHNSQQLFSPGGGNVRPLCPTRWTVRHGATGAVLKNYKAPQDTFRSENETCHDEYGRRAGGLLAVMETFDTYFGL